MESSPLSPVVEEAFDAADRALAGVSVLELDPRGIDEANACLRRLEQLQRSVESTRARMVVAAEASAVFAADAHRNASTWMARVDRLPRGEARRRVRLARTVRDLPAVAKAFEAGHIGACQVDRIAVLLRNPRVRARAIALDEDLAVIAAGLPYPEFDAKLKQWEQLTDADGAGSHRRRHAQRDARFTTGFDGDCQLRANHASVEAAELRTIFDAYLEDEVAADWADARERLGDEATWSELRRTDAQRRADALLQIFRDANAHRDQTPGKASVEAIIVVDAATAADAIDRLAPTLGRDPGPRAPGVGWAAAALTPTPDPAGVHGRASTLDGHPVDAAEAMRLALANAIRVAVVDQRGVCINLGRSQRLYKGPAQKAARISWQRCAGPGCDCPATRTQTDHIDSWANGGRTDQDNAACLCGYHNRLKEAGFTMTRGPDGQARWFRPDGTEIEP